MNDDYTGDLTPAQRTALLLAKYERVISAFVTDSVTRDFFATSPLMVGCNPPAVALQYTHEQTLHADRRARSGQEHLDRLPILRLGQHGAVEHG